MAEVDELSALKATNLSKTIVPVQINNSKLDALIDTGSSQTFIDENIAKNIGLKVIPYRSQISLASSNSNVGTVWTTGTCSVNLELNGKKYSNFSISVLSGLCCDVIIGHEILSLHDRLIIHFMGSKGDIEVTNCRPHDDTGTGPLTCNLARAIVDPPRLFSNLSEKCYPIKCQSKRFSTEDQEFIAEEVLRLQKEGLVEPSESP